MIYFPAKSFCRSAGERLSTDHHLTTYLSGLFRRIIFTLPHSFMLTATSAGICAHRTNSRAVSLHIAGCHSSPTTVTRLHGLLIFGDASFENPVPRQFPRWSDHELTTIYVSPQSFTKFHTMNLVPATIFIHVRL